MSAVPPDPRNDQEILLRLQRAFGGLLRTLDDVYMRRSDQARRSHEQVEIEVPDPYSFGGIDGLTQFGWHNVIKPVNEQIDAVMALIYEYHQGLHAYYESQGMTAIDHYPPYLREWLQVRAALSTPTSDRPDTTV